MKLSINNHLSRLIFIICIKFLHGFWDGFEAPISLSLWPYRPLKVSANLTYINKFITFLLDLRVGRKLGACKRDLGN